MASGPALSAGAAPTMAAGHARHPINTGFGLRSVLGDPENPVSVNGKNNRNTCVAYKMAGIPVFLPVVLQDLTTMVQQFELT